MYVFCRLRPCSLELQQVPRSTKPITRRANMQLALLRPYTHALRTNGSDSVQNL